MELVGVCDVRPVDATWLQGLGAPEQARPEDLGELIERTGAEITILCTPINTHADLAVTALRAGSHLLLEKPPAASLAGFERIAAAVRETGLACRVGFQNLGSTAVPALRELIGSGELGEITGIGVAGAAANPGPAAPTTSCSPKPPTPPPSTTTSSWGSPRSCAASSTPPAEKAAITCGGSTLQTFPDWFAVHDTRAATSTHLSGRASRPAPLPLPYLEEPR
ncbi:Gfo/Idh/MocA family oxidoreductase [Nonomuraea sp. NPDC049152]|uniref:Gfo/Idh/MocA family protein n=1 Tax=Nonomuraea sp. NPDC049152 TaxID=3154350 RepID=UPI00340471D4